MADPFEFDIENDELQVPLNSSASLGIAKNPDSTARMVTLAKKLKIPTSLIRHDDGQSASVMFRRNEFARLPEFAPKTAAFVAADQDNAALVQDDLDNTTKVEGLFGYLNLAKQSLKTALPRAGKGLNELGYNLTLLTGGQALARAMGDEDPGKLWTDRMAKFQKQIDANSPVKPASKGQELFSTAADSVTGSLMTLPLGLAGKVPMLFGFAATAPGQLDDYLKAGYSPAQSAYMSLSNKSMEGLTELIGVQHLYKAGKPLGKKLASFMLGDLFGEEINTAYNALMDKGTLQPDMTLADFGQQVVDTAVVTAMAGGIQGAMTAPIAKLSQEYQRSQQADLNKNFMLALGEAAGESKLSQRLPEKFQELVARLKEGGEIENVYLPADQWKTYWQEKGVDPAQMADDTFEGGSAQYIEALAAGGDLVIPIEVYASTLAATEHHATLLEHSRLQPGDLTAFEASQFASEQEQMLADLKAEAENSTVERPSYFKVYDDIFGQLQRIGYDRQTAEQYATIAAVRAKQRAAVLGVDAFELYNESPLKIVRPLPDGVQRQSVDMGLDPLIDRLRAGDIPTDESIFGQSLLQFVRERGVKDDRGDLKSMEVDGSRKPGQKNILRQDGMDLDKVREAAVESGYLSEGATTADLLDALDQELRGTPVYSQQVQNPQGQETKLALEELKQHLDQVGLDYNQLSNEQIRRELYQGQGGGLFQSAFHGSPHTFDKFSMSAIGTGEGAQAYGWGLYFASSRDVAEYYKKALESNIPLAIDGKTIEQWRDEINTPIWSHVDQYFADGYNTKDMLLMKLDFAREYEKSRGNKYFPDSDFNKVIETIKGSEKIERKGKGRLYKVELAPSEDEYLLWDKPLLEQSEHIRRALKEVVGGNPTGENIYNYVMSGWENSDYPREEAKRAASEYLHSLGIRGIKYLDGTSRGKAGKQNFNYVIFSEDDVEIKEFWQKQQTTKRGFFRTSPDQAAREIGLLQDADLSTFVHELGHSWLEELKADASRPDAPEQLKNDWATIAKWLGTTGDITREQHEQFARGGEAYLMEGKAPSADLQPIFQRFRSWLVSIYKTLTSLNVKLNDDVRGVFDRLLASEAEIRQARQAQNLVELFATKEDAGMTSAEFAAYRKQAEAAHLAEVDKLNAKLLQEKAREQAKWWKEAREELRAEVEAEAQAAPVYRAIRLLSTGKMFDGSEGPALKLDRAALVKAYGEPFLKRLPRGFNRIYTTEGGQHPDQVASLFGYESGDAMLKAMIESPPIKTYIETETDIRMRETHGDLMLDGTIADEAQAAIHGDQRGVVLAAELKAIKRQQRAAKPVLDAQKAEDRQNRNEMNASIPSRETFQMAAAQIIGAKKVGDITPRLYLEAERRAGKKAFDAVAKKDWQTAGEAKQQQMLNHYLYREASKAKEQIDDILTGFDKLRQPDAKLAKTRDIDLVNAARAILARYQIENNGLDSAAALAQIQQYNPEVYQDLSAAVDAATQNPKPYKQLTMDEFLTVNDAVMNLWNLSRRSKQIEIDGRLMNRDEVIDELNARMEEVGLPANQAGKRHAVTKWEKFSAALVGVRAATTRVEAWVDAMDGGKPGGVFRRYIWNPVIDGVNQYRPAKNEYLTKYHELLKQIETGITHDKIDAVELNYTFNGKSELLGALLHTGNESNLEKLLVGREWGFIAEDGGLDTTLWDRFINRMIDEGKLTKADYDFIQGVWDLMEEAKPLSQKAHHEMYGYYFSEISANEFTNQFGTYRGGYAPAIVDSDINQDQASRQEKEALESTNNSFMFPSTGRGFTKSRVTYNKPLVLDLRLVPSALDKVLRFSFIEPRVKDVGRVVVNPAFREVLNQFNASAGGDMLVPWLQRTARQTVSTPSAGTAGRALDKTFQVIRRNTGLQMMVANIANTLQQFTGLALSATKVKPSYLKSALWRYVQHPRAITAEVSGLSAFMAEHTNLSAYDMQQQAEDVLLNPNAYEKVKDFSVKNGYILQQITQHTVNVVTWAGAYDQAIAEGAGETDAVRQADSAVRMTQGTFNPEDVSRLETGSPFVRAFTQFYTYFNMQSNLLGSAAVGAIREGGIIGAAPTMLKLYAAFAVAAIASEVITMTFKGGPDPDDDVLDVSLQLMIMSQVRTGLAMVPFAGQLINLTINQTDNKRYNDRLSTAPFVSQIEATFRAPVSVYNYAMDDGSMKMAVKDSLSAIGMATGLPTGALGRPLGYLAGIEDGKYEPKNTLDLVRGLIHGSPSK